MYLPLESSRQRGGLLSECVSPCRKYNCGNVISRLRNEIAAGFCAEQTVSCLILVAQVSQRTTIDQENSSRSAGIYPAKSATSDQSFGATQP